jgi:N-acetylglucosaminyl-diphospho-decaprenol L-rhamnosyltransferase
LILQKGERAAQWYARQVPPVDVVIVSYNSRAHLRRCVEPLAGLDDVRVIVVDNASTDGSLETVAHLDVTTLALGQNGGFAYGCNVGWRSGDAPFVLLLNPDARIDHGSLDRLVRVLERDSQIGAAGPKIIQSDGSLEFSQRRFPRLGSAYARALFLHRLLPNSAWTNGIVRDMRSYDRDTSPEWLSGACILLRRSALELLDGLDESFFLYCEDVDLCRRLRQAGLDIRYIPEAVAIHEGGGSAPRPSLLPVLAASRVRYAQKHHGRLAGMLERLGIGLEALTHVFVSKGGLSRRAGHARSLRAVAGRSSPSDA